MMPRLPVEMPITSLRDVRKTAATTELPAAMLLARLALPWLFVLAFHPRNQNRDSASPSPFREFLLKIYTPELQL
jgi:hypothetical protein